MQKACWALRWVILQRMSLLASRMYRHNCTKHYFTCCMNTCMDSVGVQNHM